MSFKKWEPKRDEMCREQLIKVVNIIKWMVENEFEEKGSFIKLEQNGA